MTGQAALARSCTCQAVESKRLEFATCPSLREDISGVGAAIAMHMHKLAAYIKSACKTPHFNSYTQRVHPGLDNSDSHARIMHASRRTWSYWANRIDICGFLDT